MALFSFNSADHAAPRALYDILPRGWYQAILSESGASATSAGGQRLTFTATVTAPEWAKGRKVFLGFNVAHPTSEEAVRIGNEQLSGLSVAVGVPSWTNTEQLHNQPFYMRLKIRKGGMNEQTKEEYDDSNEAQGFDNLKNYHDMAKQPVPQGQTAAPAAGAFPVAAPGLPAGAPASAFPGAAPVVAAPAVPATTVPVAPALPVAAPVVQAAAPVVPVVPATPAVVANAPVQPWEQPVVPPAVAAAPVLQAPAEVAQQVAAPVAPVVPVAQAAAPVAPVVADPFAGWTPEQIITWKTQNPTHPLAQVAAAPAAPEAPVAAPQPEWAATPVVATPAATPSIGAAAAPAASEPAHPAQAMLPPWQVGAAAQ